MNPEIFTFFARYIEKELGIVYSEFNSYQLENRLTEVVKMLGLRDIGDLQRQVQANLPGPMKQVLLDIATNNETSFFRDPKLFTAVVQEMLPAFRGKKLRIWSAACSSGQEPYTLGMLHLENPVAASLEIVATDIATGILQRAAAGKYSTLEIQRGLTDQLAQKYFVKDGANSWTVKPVLRSLVKFHQMNLLDSLNHAEKFDIIFCRNVLIYQSVENKSRVIEKLSRCLTPSGLLVLGAGESLLGLSQAYTTVQTANAVYYRLNAVGTHAA